MRLLELHLTHFGKFHDKTIRLQPGINIIEGKNEAGKSTMHTFICAMLFGFDGGAGKQAIYDRCLPWENKGGYGGAIRFEEAGHIYFLERSFLKNNPTISLRDETLGQELKPAREALKRLLGGITESGYRNTVSIGQMQGATDEGLFAELKKNIASLGRAKNMEINLQAATEGLIRKRKSLETELIAGAQEEQKKLLASVYQVSQELTEQQEEAAELEEKAAAGRAREYEEFSAKQEEREQLKRQMEDINQEYSRLLHEKERWQKEKDNARGQLGRQFARLNDADLDSGIAPSFMKSPAPKLLVAGILILLLAQLCFMSYIRELSGAEELFSYSLYLGIGAAAAGMLALAAAFAAHRHHKKRMNYYRLIVDKHMRLKEASTALVSIESRRTALLAQLSEESNGDYYELHSQNEELEKEIMRLEWEQEQTIGRLNTLKKQLAIADAQCKKNEACRQEIQAVRMALENLFIAADEIQDTFGDEMNEKASKYLLKVTDGAYTGIRFEGEQKITLKSGTREVPLECVSRGTIEQVYLCIRLAAAECLSPGVCMPLLLDDTFAFYDDVRTKKAMELLKSSDHQVLIMTCQGREKRLLNEK